MNSSLSPSTLIVLSTASFATLTTISLWASAPGAVDQTDLCVHRWDWELTNGRDSLEKSPWRCFYIPAIQSRFVVSFLINSMQNAVVLAMMSLIISLIRIYRIFCVPLLWKKSGARNAPKKKKLVISKQSHSHALILLNFVLAEPTFDTSVAAMIRWSNFIHTL